ncbi:hypothetical protein BMR1_02g01425 [Babesia microti strain RI]|uniref:Uncharacterized protein n=1 Tax=Babesia microti (strain RI) TaxID=1133968 RepID=I7IG85_BABMR|nr:hypothetical protein BMR1_02g01425 [Babesia microti strain RI]CCF73446.1 hypothetical protein BMR1_02g01425 [Babesia microti strain RI]|eukprot:XP_012648055.1 hypothetical protein BMR1_02g01425 [Babesia microti strain RI]
MPAYDKLINCLKSEVYINVISKRHYRHWGKNRFVDSTFFKIKDHDGPLYRNNTPGTIKANQRNLPNRKTRWWEYKLVATASGGYALRAPYPPTINYTLDPYPKSASKYYPANKIYPLKYKNVHYICLKRQIPKPHGKKPFVYDITRVDMDEFKRKN